jgi:plastocyanin
MKKVVFAFALLLAAFALAACGGDDDSDTNGGGAATEAETTEEAGGGGGAEGGTADTGAVLDFEAAPDESLAYTTDEATAKAGKVTINFTNPQALSHDVAIEDSGGETIARTDVIGKGSDSTTANLKPGEYTFYCSVPGHRQAGMEGTLTVE